MKLRQALASLLAAEKIDTLFGLMGDGNMHLVLDAVEQHGMRFVNARHETAAVLMADGYARAGGRVAAVTMTHGPGLAAAGLGIGVAQAAHSPLLIIAGDVGRAEALHVQAMDQETFAHAVAQDVVSLRTARGAMSTLQRAMGRLRRGDGPVVLSLAVDVQEEEVPAADIAAPRLAAAASLVAQPTAVAQIAELLRGARHPILLAGRGAREAAPYLIDLAEHCNALLATTIPARGLFHGHARDLGVMGGLTAPERRAFFERADLVLAFGASLNRFTADHGRIAPNAQWVQVARDNRGLPPQVSVSLSVHGDAAEVARRLIATTSQAQGVWSVAELGAVRVAPAPAATTPGTLDPRRVVEAVNAALPPDRIDVVGVGHFGGWPAMYTEIGRGGQFIAPWDFGAIGVAVPVATGAALARPDCITVAWEGDGSLLASLGELETLARTGARVIVIVMDDGAYTAEVRKLRLLGRDTSLACFGRADLAAAAQALGLAAHTATDEASLTSAVHAASRAEGPVLIHVHIDPEVHQEVF